MEEKQMTYFKIIIGFLILCTFLYMYYYNKLGFYTSNLNKYKIELLPGSQLFHENYEEKMKLIRYVTDRPTLYIPNTGYGYSIYWEMYIPTIPSNKIWQSNYSSVKPIFTMKDSPQIGYNPKKNYLSLIIKFRDNPFYSQFTELKYENIKLQKWNKYLLVIDNKNIKLYENGILVKANVIESVPILYDINSEVQFGKKNHNFLGQIKNFYMVPYPLSNDEISTIWN